MNKLRKLEHLIKEYRTLVKESLYPIYHNSYTSAVNAALKYVEVQGYTYDKEEVSSKIGMGPAKPQEGKTNKFTIELEKGGKPQRKALHIQIYGMDGGKFELNCYIA